MSSLIHADIFFFVTTILVVIVAAIFIVLLVYAIISVRTLFRISKTIESETNKIVGDVEELRAGLHKRHASAKATWATAKRFFRKFYRS